MQRSPESPCLAGEVGGQKSFKKEEGRRGKTLKGGASESGGMDGARYRPRKMKLEALVATLVGEHALMGEGLVRAREAASRNDYEAVRTELKKLDPVFRQHIADEESQILGLLIGKLGARGPRRRSRSSSSTGRYTS